MSDVDCTPGHEPRSVAATCTAPAFHQNHQFTHNTQISPHTVWRLVECLPLPCHIYISTRALQVSSM